MRSHLCLHRWVLSKAVIRLHDHDEVRIILAAPYPGRPRAYLTTIALGPLGSGDWPVPPAPPHCSDSRCLDHAERRVRRDDPLKPEARPLEEALIFLLGALSASEQDQHVQVHRLRRARPIVRRDDHLN